MEHGTNSGITIFSKKKVTRLSMAVALLLSVGSFSYSFAEMPFKDNTISDTAWQTASFGNMNSNHNQGNIQKKAVTAINESNTVIIQNKDGMDLRLTIPDRPMMVESGFKTSNNFYAGRVAGGQIGNVEIAIFPEARPEEKLATNGIPTYYGKNYKKLSDKDVKGILAKRMAATDKDISYLVDAGKFTKNNAITPTWDLSYDKGFKAYQYSANFTFPEQTNSRYVILENFKAYPPDDKLIMSKMKEKGTYLDNYIIPSARLASKALADAKTVNFQGVTFYIPKIMDTNSISMDSAEHMLVRGKGLDISYTSRRIKEFAQAEINKMGHPDDDFYKMLVYTGLWNDLIINTINSYSSFEEFIKGSFIYNNGQPGYFFVCKPSGTTQSNIETFTEMILTKDNVIFCSATYDPNEYKGSRADLIDMLQTFTVNSADEAPGINDVGILKMNLARITLDDKLKGK